MDESLKLFNIESSTTDYDSIIYSKKDELQESIDMISIQIEIMEKYHSIDIKYIRHLYKQKEKLLSWQRKLNQQNLAYNLRCLNLKSTIDKIC
jgi:hypothetical protein